MTVNCPDCGAAAEGNFCARCGAPLQPRACPSCGAEVPAGARFCTRCGTSAPGAPPVPAGGAAKPGGTRLPWMVAGAAAIAFITLLLARGCEDRSPAALAPATGAPSAADPRAIDLSAMSPGEAADRLFERVMRAASGGDSAQARQFAPMALAAYERVPELDDDQHYHVAVLHLFQDRPEAAEAHADSVLARAPDHLLALLVSAQTRRARGDQEGARDRYRRFLEVYPDEITADREEYRAHAPVLAEGREEARTFLR